MPTPKRFDAGISVQMPKEWRIKLDALAMVRIEYTGDVVREILRNGIPDYIDSLSPEDREKFERNLEIVKDKYALKGKVRENPEPV